MSVTKTDELIESELEEEEKEPLSFDGDYDLTKVYEEKIIPLLDEIKKICIKHHLPYAFMFATKNGKDNTEYRKHPEDPAIVGAEIQTDGLMSASMGRKLYDERFNSFLLLLRGGKFVPPAKDVEDEYLFNKIADQLQEIDDDDYGCEDDAPVEVEDLTSDTEQVKASHKKLMGKTTESEKTSKQESPVKPTVPEADVLKKVSKRKRNKPSEDNYVFDGDMSSLTKKSKEPAEEKKDAKKPKRKCKNES